MAEGILGLGSSQLNQELLDKLKDAERVARVKPIEDQLNSITEEGGESDTLKSITDQVNQFLESVKPFDLFVKGGVNAFDQKVANVTGTSAVFDAVDVGQISEGTTEVFIEQLAKKDVYQTNTFADKEAVIATSSSIDINGKTFTTQGEDFESLAQAINDEGSITATYDSGANTLTINDGVNGDVVFSTDGKTYSDLATDIDADVNFSSSIPAKPISGDMLTLNQPGKPVYQSDIRVSNDDIIDATGGTITINVDGVDKEFTVNADTTYGDLIAEINLDEELDAKLSSEGRLSISHKDKETDITVTESLTTETLGMSRGEKFSTEGLTYEELAKKINNNSSYTANVESVGENQNRLVIKSSESGLENAITITQTGVDLGLNEASNHTVSAQNMKATVDGIDYDVSSNVIVVDGGLKITAVEKNEPGEFSSISIEKDVSTVEPLLQDFVSQYNALISVIDDELYSSESSIDDKSTLRTVVEGIKDKLFGSYGDDKLSIFNFGFEVDKNGVLSLDSTKFNEAMEDDIGALKDLFIGAAESPGLGTDLKEYVDSLDSFDGLLTKYEENMNSRKESLQEDVDSAQESLDSRYALLAQQFASYGAVIAQFENQFAGLKMMIEQSVSGN
ncbi:MAG: flagellar filament capping protein FliD [Halarcobacter ebronensis]|uniref:flagellar filament capping protein FliD n=1 Tax=Halarcobacter ebronensis TaxID=1462615 RepID=UPI003C775091